VGWLADDVGVSMGGKVSGLAGLARRGREIFSKKSRDAAGTFGLSGGNNVAGSSAVAWLAGDGSSVGLVLATLAVFAGGSTSLVVVFSCDAVGAGCFCVGDNVAGCSAAARPARDFSVVGLIESCWATFAS